MTYFVKTTEVYLLLKIGFDLHGVLSLTGHQGFCRISEIGCFNLRNLNGEELNVLHKRHLVKTELKASQEISWLGN